MSWGSGARPQGSPSRIPHFRAGGGAQMPPCDCICPSVKRASNIAHTAWSRGKLHGDNPRIMRGPGGPHSRPPCLEPLDHMIGASRGPGRQSRLSPPPRGAPARPPSRRAARERLSAQPGSRPRSSPLAALAARPRPGSSAAQGVQEELPAPRDLGGPGGPSAPPPGPGGPHARPPADGPGLLAQLRRGGGRAPQPPRQAQHGAGRALPTAGRAGLREPGPPRAQAEVVADLGCGAAGKGACVLTDQPDSEHQLNVRRLIRSHLPPPPQQQLQPPARRPRPLLQAACPLAPPSGCGPASLRHAPPRPEGPAPAPHFSWISFSSTLHSTLGFSPSATSLRLRSFPRFL